MEALGAAKAWEEAVAHIERPQGLRAGKDLDLVKAASRCAHNCPKNVGDYRHIDAAAAENNNADADNNNDDMTDKNEEKHRWHR